MNFDQISNRKAKQIVSMYKNDLKERFMYKSVDNALQRADEYTGLIKKIQGLDLNVVEAIQIKQIHPAFDVYSTWPEVHIRINGDLEKSYKIFSQAFSDNLNLYISKGVADLSSIENTFGMPKIIRSNIKDGIKSYEEFGNLFAKQCDGQVPNIIKIDISGKSQISNHEDINIVYGLNVKPTLDLKNKVMNVFSKKYVNLL